VDLGYAGRHTQNHCIHAVIAALRPGDPLTLHHTELASELLSADGTVVGRLARRYQAPAGMDCVATSVAAIIQRRRDDITAEYADHLAVDVWEVVVPALTYALSHNDR
jgi:ATP-dependent DNA helicase RecQ